VVEIHLVAVGLFNVSSLPVNGTKIHVQEVGGAVDIEGSGGNTVFAQVGGTLFGIACGGQHEQHLVETDLLFNAVDQSFDGVVELHVDTFHFGLPVRDRTSVCFGGRKRDV